MAWQHFMSFLEHANARGSRSTALKPLGWLLLILTSFVLGLVYRGVSGWLLVGSGIALGLCTLTYLGSYIYLILTNIDATRSESFLIRKMQLQHSRVGDDAVGFSLPNPFAVPDQLNAGSSQAQLNDENRQ
jgi:hypothetical protein